MLLLKYFILLLTIISIKCQYIDETEKSYSYYEYINQIPIKIYDSCAAIKLNFLESNYISSLSESIYYPINMITVETIPKISRFIKVNTMNWLSIDNILYYPRDIILVSSNYILFGVNNYILYPAYEQGIFFTKKCISTSLTIINDKFASSLNSEFIKNIYSFLIYFGNLVLFLGIIFIALTFDKKITNLLLFFLLVYSCLGLSDGVYFIGKLIFFIAEFAMSNFIRFCITLIVIVNINLIFSFLSFIKSTVSSIINMIYKPKSVNNCKAIDMLLIEQNKNQYDSLNCSYLTESPKLIPLYHYFDSSIFSTNLFNWMRQLNVISYLFEEVNHKLDYIISNIDIKKKYRNLDKIKNE